LNNPVATRNAITPSGWFKTGDVGVVREDGYFTIVDRKKELIKYKARCFFLTALPLR
jgi:4-coumarate--CoA ligase